MLVKKITAGLLISGITASLLLVGTEFVMRYAQGLNYYKGECFQPDPILDHKAIPNSECVQKTDEWLVTYKNNSLGLRGAEIGEKAKGVYRILVLGDSFPYGTGVPEDKIFPRLLEKKLNEHYRGNPKIEVINAGIPSYSPLPEYLYLVNEGMKLKPDLVLLEFDLTDFVNEVDYLKNTQYKDGKPVSIGATQSADVSKEIGKETKVTVAESDDKALPFVPLSIKKYIHEHSLLYAYVATKVKLAMHKQVGDAPKTGLESYYTIVGHDTSLDEKQFEEPKKNLKLINDFLKEKNVKFIVSAHPWGLIVNDKEWLKGKASQGLVSTKVYSPRYIGILSKILAEQKVPFVDLLPVFKESKDFPLFFSFDGHLTQKGQELVADTLYVELEPSLRDKAVK